MYSSLSVEQLVEVEGLGQVVVGTRPHRLDCRADGAEGRHQDHRHLGIVRARFNDAITLKLAEACLAELDRLDVDPGDIRHVTVP
jgi:hypothetical protein